MGETEERLAEAVAQAVWDQEPHPPTPYRDLTPAIQETLKRRARTAIAVVRAAEQGGVHG